MFFFKAGPAQNQHKQFNLKGKRHEVCTWLGKVYAVFSVCWGFFVLHLLCLGAG
jgi:hypothetical protein